jgi:hypothetical protein
MNNITRFIGDNLCGRPVALDLRYRIVNEDFHSWEGRDVFQMSSFYRYSFFETTGETPETLLDIVRQLSKNMFQAVRTHP